MTIQSVNPATGQKLKEFPALKSDEIEEKLRVASRELAIHKESSFFERERRLLKVAEILENEREKWARLMTLEMGKPIRAAGEEAAKCAWVCRYYAENAERFLSDEIVRTTADQSFVRFQPLGAILAIMPWNFPFWQVFRFAAPALMAGNVALLKHASNVPQCALAIEGIFRSAGFPEGVFQTLLISSAQAESLIEDPRIAAITLTGSEGAGIAVGQNAGRHIKKVVLELGGSDPFIVMPSSPLEETVRMAVVARTINNGQSCVAAKRFIVADPIANEFEKRFAQAMKVLKVGDPLDPTVQVGPLATAQTLASVEQTVNDSIGAGARVLAGGRRIDRPGFFYEPSVLTDIPKSSPAYHEEVFGPVALVFRAKDIDEALRIANSSRFGLGASLWSSDPAEQERFIDEIESGLCFVNGMVASDPRLPFGGIKNSGHGRELSHFGIREFVNIKTVWIKSSLVGLKGSQTE